MKHDVNPPTREKLRCELCFWWEPLRTEEDEGLCCAQAPVVVGAESQLGVFPITYAYNRCGSYSYDERKDKKGENR